MVGGQSTRPFRSGGSRVGTGHRPPVTDHCRAAGDYEWACFAAQQGAEKAVKAVIEKMGGVAWGHSVAALLASLPESLKPDPVLLDAAKALDKHYIPACYPNSHPQGAPYEYYTHTEAECALGHARQIIGFCKGLLAGPPGGASSSQAGGASAE